MFEREDLKGVNLSATLKVVGAGELRTRLRLGAELGTSIKAVHATKAAETAWQGQFHRHMLQSERYVVVTGILAVVSWVGGTCAPTGNIYGPGSNFCFDPGIWHDVMATEGAEFVTIQVAAPGEDVENDREVMIELPSGVSHEMSLLWNAVMARFG